MNVSVKRYSESKLFGGSTFGLLFIDESFGCYTLEDEKRDVKIPGETRIPDGRYKLGLRKWGRHHDEYSERFPGMHKGMIEVKDVPGFTDILIHILNYETQTDGCIGVGDAPNNNTVGKAVLGQSEQAYRRIYPTIAGALWKSEEVLLTIDTI